VTSPRTYEEREIKPLRPITNLTTRATATTLLLLLLLLLLLHALLLTHLFLLSMFERVALLPVDDGAPNRHPRRRTPSRRRRNRARCTPTTASRRRRATACTYTPATSNAIRRAEYGIFEPPRLSVKPSSGRAASIDADDDDGGGPRVSLPNQEHEPTIRRGLGEAAPSLPLPWNERRRRCGVAPRIRRRPDRDRRTASTNKTSDDRAALSRARTHPSAPSRPCAHPTINREVRTTARVLVAATAADSSSPAQPAVLSSSKRPASYRPRPAFSNRDEPPPPVLYLFTARGLRPLAPFDGPAPPP
jgi:hypothetical protein